MPDGSRRGRRFLKSDKLQVNLVEWEFYSFVFYIDFKDFAHCTYLIQAYSGFCFSLQCLFDFIDIGRVVKPGTYRLVMLHILAGFCCLLRTPHSRECCFIVQISKGMNLE